MYFWRAKSFPLLSRVPPHQGLLTHSPVDLSLFYSHDVLFFSLTAIFPFLMPYPRPSKEKNKNQKQSYALFQGWLQFHYLCQAIFCSPHFPLRQISSLNIGVDNLNVIGLHCWLIVLCSLILLPKVNINYVRTGFIQYRYKYVCFVCIYKNLNFLM